MYLLAICNVMCCVWVQRYSKGNVQCVGQKRDVSTPNEVINPSICPKEADKGCSVAAAQMCSRGRVEQLRNLKPLHDLEINC